MGDCTLAAGIHGHRRPMKIKTNILGAGATHTQLYRVKSIQIEIFMHRNGDDDTSTSPIPAAVAVSHSIYTYFVFAANGSFVAEN